MVNLNVVFVFQTEIFILFWRSVTFRGVKVEELQALGTQKLCPELQFWGGGSRDGEFACSTMFRL
jgi:hypothetical protein